MTERSKDWMAGYEAGKAQAVAVAELYRDECLVAAIDRIQRDSSAGRPRPELLVVDAETADYFQIAGHRQMSDRIHKTLSRLQPEDPTAPVIRIAQMAIETDRRKFLTLL